jgi:hypothetical protein
MSDSGQSIVFLAFYLVSIGLGLACWYMVGRRKKQA